MFGPIALGVGESGGVSGSGGGGVGESGGGGVGESGGGGVEREWGWCSREWGWGCGEGVGVFERVGMC